MTTSEKPTTGVRHPLEPLTAEEITAATDIVRADGRLPEGKCQDSDLGLAVGESVW